MHRVIETEVDVSLEKDGYILAGKLDLLLGGDGKLELLDVKTSPRPRNSPDLVAAYERQLLTYAHILEHRHRRRVDRLLLYWTSEACNEDAPMALPYRPDRMGSGGPALRWNRDPHPGCGVRGRESARSGNLHGARSENFVPRRGFDRTEGK